MTKLEEVRAAIVKVVPDLLSDCIICGCPKSEPECANDGPHVVKAREIRLADVLCALPPGIYLKTLGEQTRLIVDDPSRAEGPVYWDCTADSLDEQSEETIAFVHKILCV